MLLAEAPGSWEWVEPAILAWVASQTPALAAQLDIGANEKELLRHVGK